MKSKILAMASVLALIGVMVGPGVALADTTVLQGEVGETPTIGLLSPSHGAENTAPEVVITGTNFVDTETSVSIAGVGVAAGAVTFDSTTQIRATFTIADEAVSGPRAVTVTVAGKTSNSLDFTVDHYITVNSPDAAINIGYLTAGATKTGSSVLTGLVTTNSLVWNVTVRNAPGDGFMKNGSTPLSPTDKFRIGKTEGTYANADDTPAINYDEDDAKSPTLYYSQVVPSDAAAGIYTITLTFMGSIP